MHFFSIFSELLSFQKYTWVNCNIIKGKENQCSYFSRNTPGFERSDCFPNQNQRRLNGHHQTYECLFHWCYSLPSSSVLISSFPSVADGIMLMKKEMSGSQQLVPADQQCLFLQNLFYVEKIIEDNYFLKGKELKVHQ